MDERLTSTRVQSIVNLTNRLERLNQFAKGVFFMSAAGQHSKKTIANFFGDLEGPGFGLDDKFFIIMGQRIAERAQIRPGSTVLDVASGTGTSLFPAAEIVGETGKVIGTDLAIEMVQKTGAEIKRRGVLHLVKTCGALPH